MSAVFAPKLLTTLKSYTRRQFINDLVAGIVVGIVALPLAIAFGIASGVTPEKGLITAIIAGFIISALGGSRVQIGGPTGAFIVIVYGIVHDYGVTGLTIATFMAGFMLIIMGLARMGSIIKFIPHPLIVGFTTGIAVIIFSSQIKDFLGLTMGAMPAGFIDKWAACWQHISTVNFVSLAIGIATVLITMYFGRITRRIPGSLVAIVLCAAAAAVFHLPVETIGSRFGAINGTVPAPEVHPLSVSVLQQMVRPAFTIALLGAIESLLSAVVADGMIGGSHRSNTELIAQGTANIASSLFGGIPATGAIARTATNVKNGGRTPVAGMVHAVTLLVIMLFVGKWASLIPMACLAGILVVVAYNMSEWRSFAGLLKGPREDALVLLASFFLTVLVDLTIAIEIGLVLSAFLFISRMVKVSKVDIGSRALAEEDDDNDHDALKNYTIPQGVEVFEIKGPFFFGAAYKFKEAMAVMEKPPRVLIIRMRYVPVIDATAIHALERVFTDAGNTKISFILSGVQAAVYEELAKAGLIDRIGSENVCADLGAAIKRSQTIAELPKN